jgi:hypothetical protein
MSRQLKPRPFRGSGAGCTWVQFSEAGWLATFRTIFLTE